jgi:hypothetical protein
MIHVLLLIVLLALFPRALLRAIGCAIWAVILLVVVCLFLDDHAPKRATAAAEIATDHLNTLRKTE